MAMKIKKGDMVVVVTGDDATVGRSGEVLRVFPERSKVLDISNVMLVDPETSQPTRVGFRIGKDGVKERYAKKSGASLGALTKADGK